MNDIDIEKLVTDNIRLIYFVIKKMNLYGDYDDYFDLGAIGLVQAAKTFDPNLENSFSSYACKCIQNEINKEFRKNASQKRRANFNTVSLNTVIHSDSNGNELWLSDCIPDNFNMEEYLIKKENIRKIIDILYGNDTTITESEKLLILCHYVYGITQRDLAKMLHTTQVTILRRLKRAIKKIKEAL